ncbi:LpqB family beta-propeller domain-containing protein [Leucobacter sp. 1207-22]|uniref:LpqB family beta-propeller domain-containing protein n=1 Tax=Leucobacter sp. 1207-22 TaxID=2604456 RepID=UPI0040630414
MTRTRRLGLPAVLALSAVLVTGCTAIPTHGPVEVGLDDLAQGEQQVQFNPSGPLVGSSQENLVRGFVLAATSSTDDYAVAREFLTPDYAQQWDPYAGVIIDEGTRPFRKGANDTGLLSVSQTAEIDESGTLSPSRPGPSIDMRFEFEMVGNEWRIASAPAGIIVDRANFSSIWSAHQLYFLDRNGQLAPETRWFLNRAALPTEIVTELLEGPSSLFITQVANAFPAGARVRGDSVVIIDGIAQVDLTGFTPPTHADERKMLDQLLASLQAVPGCSGVRLSIDGVVIAEDQETDQKSKPQARGRQLIGAREDGFGPISNGVVHPMANLSAAITELEPDAVSLGRNDALAAVRHEGGVSLVTQSETSIIDSRAQLLEPSIDDWDWAWTVAADAPSLARLTSDTGEQTDMRLPWPNTGEVVAVRVAPGGNLIAALMQDGSNSVVLVAGITRDETGRPIGIAEKAVEALWTSGGPIDLDWIDHTRFAVLTGTNSSTSKVTVGGVGVFSYEQGSVPDGIQISGSGGRAQLRVRSASDFVFAPQGGGWQRVETDVTALATRG